MKTLKYKNMITRPLFLFIVSLLVSVTSFAQVSPAERQALIDFYNATDGDNWTNTVNSNSPWLINDPSSLVSDWYGVTVVNGNVTQLNLSRNNLAGTIPSGIGNLSSLGTMNLARNALVNAIPETIGGLTMLQSLNLSDNQLSGNIPITIGNLSDLQGLFLNRNTISGSIPVEIGTLSSLIILDLNSNQLTGEIPQTISNLNSLSDLSANNNQLSGNIPEGLYDLTTLKNLQLANNLIVGEISPRIGNLTGLELILLQNNKLTGTIPAELGMLVKMKILNLAFNQLSGDMPGEFKNLVALTNFYINGNQLKSLQLLPNVGISNLTVSFVDNNQFVFSDFENEFNAYQTKLGTNFKYTPQAKVDQEETLSVIEGSSITLSSTALTSPNNSYQWYKDGVAIAGATDKDYVINTATNSDAGVYHFTATNSVVTNLTLERNAITLIVEADTCGVSAIEKQALIDLYNATDGANWTNTVANNKPWDPNTPVCDWYGVGVENGKVTTIWMLQNNITGSLPISIGDLTNLTTLYLYRNGIEGTIPATIGNLTNLTSLTLGENRFTGEIPVSIGNLTSLTALNLFQNLLSGTIPTELSNLTNLRNLNLNRNRLSGAIPASLGNLTELTNLGLDSNSLTGEIPIGLSNLDQLEVLHLYRNQLTGSIPEGIGSLPKLSNFSVESNLLSGKVPSGLATLVSNGVLKAMSFARNAFVFSDFETEFATYNTNLTGGFGYNIQAKVDQAETLSVTENGTITLTSTALTSANNSYQWYKDGVAIAGATSKDYVINTATNSDAGVYYFTVTNSIVSGLNLERNPITLIVEADTCGVSAIEKQALIDLYNATDGANWANNANWLSDAPVCDWYGITVENGNVTRISLTSLGLNGSIPPSIGNLLELEYLYLATNKGLTGTIPVEIGNLNKLSHLFLANCSLSGEIPSELGNLEQLKSLNIRGNNISSSIPSELGNLSKLTHLYIDNNNLSGTIPAELGNLKSLTHLYSNGNNLSGAIPIELSGLSSVKFIFFQNNKLSRVIPKEIINSLSSLEQLSITNNNFVFSDFETEFNAYQTKLGTNFKYTPQAKVDQAETLSVTEGGTITLSSTALTSFDNSYQWYKDGVAITGATSKDYVINNATNSDAGVYHFIATNSIVTNLTLERNAITLSVTANSCGVSAIEKQALIDLYNATDGANWTNTWDLNTPVCDWYGVTVSANKVIQLDLNNNNLSGNITESIVNITELSILRLYGNALTGIIPEKLYSHERIRFLNLRDNQLIGEISSSINQMINLERLDLGRNNLNGGIPRELGALTLLTDLRLNDNQLTGSIPEELGQLVNLTQAFYLYSNQLNGSIPESLGQLTLIKDLRFGGNKLSGSIPQSFENLINLETLLLENNQLEGQIPNFSNIVSARLFIENNNFVFSDFESEHFAYQTNVSSYRFSPQAKVDQKETLSITEGGTITLSSTALTSPNNSYQWYKDGVAITGATSKDYVINTATNSDAGVYHFIATNSIVTNLTLERNAITLAVTEDTCGVSAVEKQALIDLYIATDGPNWTNTVASNKPWDPNTPVCDWYGITVENEKLIRINLQGNNLFGNIPASIGTLSNLQSLNLRTNKLTESIPSSIGDLTELQQLELSQNIPLRGTIVDGIRGLKKLTQLSLSNTGLTGGIPSWIGELINLEILELSGGGRLGGSIPSSIGNLKKLRLLRLNGAKIEGEIPIEMGELPSLEVLYLSENELTGSIPLSFENLPKLGRAFFHKNQLSGKISEKFLNTTTISDLRIDNNRFVFSDINVSLERFPDYYYSPQAKVDQTETLSVTENGTITLTSIALTSPNNSYQWYKDGVAIPGATSKEYTINNATAANAGVYHFTATNSIVTNLTLERNPITIVLEPTSSLTQAFCNADNPIFVRDLTSPFVGEANWSFQQNLQFILSPDYEITSTATLWARPVNNSSEPSISVQILINDGAPTASHTTQTFLAVTNPTIANLIAQGTNIRWYESVTSATPLLNTLPLVHNTPYYAEQDGSSCRLKILVNIISSDPDPTCNILENYVNGSFEDCFGQASWYGHNNNVTCGNWVNGRGTADTWNLPFQTHDGIAKNIPDSPDGGVIAGGIARSGNFNEIESFYTTLNSLEIGAVYTVKFYQSNVTGNFNFNGGQLSKGRWKVLFGDQTLYAPYMTVTENPVWEEATLEFTAATTEARLEFLASSANIKESATYVYMMIDGIRLTKVGGTSVDCPQDVVYEEQKFCTMDRFPTVADLSAPGGASNVSWYSQETGGYQFEADAPLGLGNQNTAVEVYWADSLDYPSRVPVTFTLDEGAPLGDSFPTFSALDNATVGDLQVQGTAVQWYDSSAGLTPLPLNTALVDGGVYYAASAGVVCRLRIEVRITEAPATAESLQVFCGSNNPTVNNIQVTPFTSNFEIRWFPTVEGGVALSPDTPLESNTIYYAAQFDAGVEVSDRTSVFVIVLQPLAPTGPAQQVFTSNESATVGDLIAFGNNIRWFDGNGNELSNELALENGGVYYAKKTGLYSGCISNEGLEVRVIIEPEEPPVYVDCEKFRPQPGHHYVMSAWVRENAATISSTETRSFQTVKPQILELLNLLKDRIVNQVPTPAVFDPSPEERKYDVILPFINAINKPTSLKIYNLRPYRENQKGIRRTVGFVFSFDPVGQAEFFYLNPADPFSSFIASAFGLTASRVPLIDTVESIEFIDMNQNLNGGIDVINKYNYPSFIFGALGGFATDYIVTNTTGINPSADFNTYVDDTDYQVMNYEKSFIQITYTDRNGTELTENGTITLRPQGNIIDGWQRISADFKIPENAEFMTISLKNDSDNLNVYYDDIRFQPFDSSMKTFVYDPENLRLQSELDENNYATYYEYDIEGGLVRVKKETERGTYTIQETRSGNSLLNNE